MFFVMSLILHIYSTVLVAAPHAEVVDAAVEGQLHRHEIKEHVAVFVF